MIQHFTGPGITEVSQLPSVLPQTDKTIRHRTMGPTLSPETSAFKLQTPGKFLEEYKLHSEHGESLKTTTTQLTFEKEIRTQTFIQRN